MTVEATRASVDGLYQVIAEVLKVKPSAVTDQASPQTIAGWDSLRSIILVTALEERYHVTFTLAEIMGIKTVGDIRMLLERHGAFLNNH